MISLSAEDHERLNSICEQHRVRLLVAFGSRVTDRTHAASDVDLAALQQSRSDDEMALWGDLETIFPRHGVDVVWLYRADALLLFHVFRNAQLLYGDRETFLRYELYAWRRFVEYERFFALEADAVRKGIERLRRAG